MKDFRRVNCPPDRGCKTLLIDPTRLPGNPTTISGQTEDGTPAAPKTATAPDGRIQIATDPYTASYLLR